MGGGPPRRQPVGEVGGAKPRQRSALSGEPAFELFLRLAIREGMAKGAGFGAASHGAGTARSYELGQQEGVVASLVMMLSGVVVVLAAPVVRWLLF